MNNLNIEFVYTWCDYLTPCSYRENIEVGSYDCALCKHFLDSIYDIEHTGKLVNEMPVGDPRRYMVQYKGIVKCNYKLCNNER